MTSNSSENPDFVVTPSTQTNILTSNPRPNLMPPQNHSRRSNICTTENYSGIVDKSLSHCESPSIESICIELTIPKQNGIFCLHCVPPNFNKGEFFKEISDTLSKALKCYDNRVLAGDLNDTFRENCVLLNSVREFIEM